MKKIGLFVVFMCLSIAIQASANEGQKADCESTRGVWYPLAGVPQCRCTAHPELFSLLAPGIDKTLLGIRARAKVTKDVCESRELGKTSDNIKKDKGKGDKIQPVAPTPLPSCSADQNPVVAAGKEAVGGITCTGSGVKNLARYKVSCDYCTAMPSSDTIIGSKTGIYRQSIRIAPVGKPDKSKVGVTFETGKDQALPEVIFWVEWTPPAPPAPVMSAAQIACEKGKYPGIWSPETKSCSCPGTDLVEQNGVCVPKPVPPPPIVKIVEDNGSIIHPLFALMGGYDHAAYYRSAEWYAGVGLTADITNYLWAYTIFMIGTPGATRVYSDGTPVLKADGTPDNRSFSLAYEGGFLGHLDWFGLNIGANRQARGLVGATSPTVAITTGIVGLKAVLPVPGGTVVVGPDFTVGSETLGSLPSQTVLGVRLVAQWLLFPPHGRR